MNQQLISVFYISPVWCININLLHCTTDKRADDGRVFLQHRPSNHCSAIHYPKHTHPPLEKATCNHFAVLLMMVMTHYYCTVGACSLRRGMQNNTVLLLDMAVLVPPHPLATCPIPGLHPKKTYFIFYTFSKKTDLQLFVHLRQGGIGATYCTPMGGIKVPSSEKVNYLPDR